MFKLTVYKDNKGALVLAKLEPGRHSPCLFKVPCFKVTLVQVMANSQPKMISI